MNTDEKESQARRATICDGCNAEMPSNWPDNKDNISVELDNMESHADMVNTIKDASYPMVDKKTYHACSEGCLASILDKRDRMKKSRKNKMAKGVEIKGEVVEVDITVDESNAAYVSYKERNLPSTHYLDESRKSFPIRKGHECTDLEAAVSAWGRYKGSMSHDEFVGKVKGLMKTHGCPIPKAWENNK